MTDKWSITTVELFFHYLWHPKFLLPINIAFFLPSFKQTRIKNYSPLLFFKKKKKNCTYLNTVIMSPLSLLFSRLNKPSPLSLSSEVIFSRPLISALDSLLRLKVLLSTWVPQTQQTFRKSLAVLSKEITSLTLILSYVYSLYMILAFIFFLFFFKRLWYHVPSIYYWRWPKTGCKSILRWSKMPAENFY